VTEFISPTLSYSLLSPILVVFAGAIIGVLIEAFASKSIRPIAQVSVSIGTLVLALVQVWRIRNSSSTTAAMGSVIIDGPGLLLQGSILIISIIAIFLIADTENFAAA
jgi:NADH-quinone oxidoreductase subunit N